MGKLIHRARKWGTGWLSIYLDWRLKKKRNWRMPDVVLIDFMVRRNVKKPATNIFNAVTIDNYNINYAKTEYWHGTGRFQYANGNRNDIFSQLLKQRSILPFRDIFDYKEGEMLSISVARQRMYGRIYSDMHAYKGVDLSARYGSPRFWAYYFIIALSLHCTVWHM